MKRKNLWNNQYYGNYYLWHTELSTISTFQLDLIFAEIRATGDNRGFFSNATKSWDYL